jgi:hypothetical protein
LRNEAAIAVPITTIVAEAKMRADGESTAASLAGTVFVGGDVIGSISVEGKKPANAYQRSTLDIVLKRPSVERKNIDPHNRRKP